MPPITFLESITSLVPHIPIALIFNTPTPPIINQKILVTYAYTMYMYYLSKFEFGNHD